MSAEKFLRCVAFFLINVAMAYVPGLFWAHRYGDGALTNVLVSPVALVCFSVPNPILVWGIVVAAMAFLLGVSIALYDCETAWLIVPPIILTLVILQSLAFGYFHHILDAISHC